jgi:alkylation response protein AidB-like acyl-CoA dehydrogenase
MKTADEMGQRPVALETANYRRELSNRTLDAVRELAPKIRAASDEIERARRLPRHIVEQMQRAGLPESRLSFLPAEQCEIIDTWTTHGLRGSGSHDWTVKDRFIPEARTFNLAAPNRYRKGPLYTLPNLLLYKATAVVLGIARAKPGSCYGDN